MSSVSMVGAITLLSLTGRSVERSYIWCLRLLFARKISNGKADPLFNVYSCLLDFTFAYFHKTKGFGVPPDLIRVHTGRLSPEYKFHVHVKRYFIDDLPKDEEELSEWVVQRYVEKDAFLENMKETWTDGIEGGVWSEKW